MNDFNTSFVVDQSPEEVFEAINNVRGWWGEDVEGSHASVGDEFTHRVQDVHYSKLRVIERIPKEKVVWLVLENHMNHVKDCLVVMACLCGGRCLDEGRILVGQCLRHTPVPAFGQDRR